jgi:hypothetical protein
MKWLLTTFIALLVLTALQPWLSRLGIGSCLVISASGATGASTCCRLPARSFLSVLLMLLTQLI